MTSNSKTNGRAQADNAAVAPVLNYSEQTDHKAAADITVARTVDSITVTWPRVGASSRRWSAYTNLGLGVAYLALGGLLPSEVQRMLHLRHDGLDLVSIPFGICWVVLGLRGIWVIHHWPEIGRRLTITSSTVASVRMGVWWPRMAERPRTDVAAVDWTPASAFLYGRADPMRLTIRFVRGRPWRVVVASPSSAINAAVWTAVRDQLTPTAVRTS